jgi:hypothetical protein
MTKCSLALWRVDTVQCRGVGVSYVHGQSGYVAYFCVAVAAAYMEIELANK